MNLDADTTARLVKIRDDLSSGSRIAVLSGAGISAASGIPTFRGESDSLWSRYRPEEMATPEAFARDSELVWKWYDWRRSLIAASSANAAHEALVALEERHAVTIITQNVDGYHQQAGSRNVLEFHGSIWIVRCLQCHHEELDRRVPIPILPRCVKCGGLVRPGVVWFGEGIDPEVHAKSERSAKECDLFLVIGTAGAVYPAARLVAAARSAGARIVEFNLEPSGVSHLADLFVHGSAADTVPLLIN